MLIVMAILLIAILMPIIIVMMIIIIVVDECFMVWKVLLTQIISVGGLTKKIMGAQNDLIEVLVLEQAK